VLGVLVISGEYTTGMIRSSFAAVPKRLPVLWAKAGVFGAVTLTLMLPCAFVAFLVSQSMLTQHHVQTSLGQPHVLRAVVGAALFLTVVSLLGVALGALVRNTAGGIAAFAGIMFVLPGVTAILPRRLGRLDRSVPAAERRKRDHCHHARLADARSPGPDSCCSAATSQPHRRVGLAARAPRRVADWHPRTVQDNVRTVLSG